MLEASTPHISGSITWLSVPIVHHHTIHCYYYERGWCQNKEPLFHHLPYLVVWDYPNWFNIEFIMDVFRWTLYKHSPTIYPSFWSKVQNHLPLRRGGVEGVWIWVVTPELHLFSADIVLSSDIFQILDPTSCGLSLVAMGYWGRQAARTHGFDTSIRSCAVHCPDCSEYRERT